MKKIKPILHDPVIIPRVQQYLEENVDKTYVDVGVMAKELQVRYPEYGRRKSVPFRQLVEQAYKTVLHSYGLDSNPSSEGEDDDLEVMDGNESRPNQMSDALNNLYNNKSGSKAASNDNDPIDISSDDSEDDDSPPPVRITTPKVPEPPSISMSVSTIMKHTRDMDQPVENGVTKKRRVDDIPQLHPSITVTQLSGSGKSKKYKKEVIPKKSTITFKDVGGMDKTLKQLCELLMHIKHPEIYQHIGLPPPRGFLLHGPPGSGKTLLAHAIAGQLNIPLIEVPATELVAGVSGESEERIRDIFDQAAALTPCVLFIDEIDAISSNRINAQKDMERRIVAQLLNSLDGLSTKSGGNQVLVIGATNRADSLDPALRRVGRFDQEISLGIPDRLARKEILEIICGKLKLEESFDYDKLAALTPGYVGADLLALATRAASTAVKRIFKDKEQELFRKEKEPEKNLKPDQMMEVDNLLDSIANKGPKLNGDLNNDEPIQILDDTENEANIEKDTKDTENKPTNVDDDAGLSCDVAEVVAELTEKIIETSNVEEKMETDETNADIAMTEEKPEEPSSEKLVEEAEESKVIEEIEKKIEQPDLEESIRDKTIYQSTGETEATKSEEKVQDDVAVKIISGDLNLQDLLSWLNSATPPLTSQQLEAFCIRMQDFIDALKLVQPSAKREGFITVPDVTWDDIGSLADIREELKMAILAPVKFPARLKILGLSAPSGVLLCGPPGCGKTLLAKAVANEAGINFISVKGPELLNMYVGESERAVRQCFQRARNSTPCVIFFDEFDSLCPKRSESSENSAGMRVVNQLLTEMDGIEDRKDVFLMAATNRPDIVDPAVLRPGRFDKILYIGLPTEQDRTDILLATTKYGVKPPLGEDVDLKEVAQLTEGFTGADLAGLMRQAALHALRSSIVEFSDSDSIVDIKVNKIHIFNALRNIKPSVSTEDKKHYEKLREKYGHKNQVDV